MFYQKVDKRNRKAMCSFLQGHSRYFTMNACNRSTSYANNVKIHRLELPASIRDRAYRMLEVDEYHWEVEDILEEWAATYDQRWQAGFNGRSGGYLVLYQGGWRFSDYQSYCPNCGQKNFKLVPPEKPSPWEALKLLANWKRYWSDNDILSEYRRVMPNSGLTEEEALEAIRAGKADAASGKEYSADNRCGVCKSPRVNFITPPKEVFKYPGRPVDQDEDFTAWDLSDLRDRVELVQDFDRLCDKLRAHLIRMCRKYKVVEKTIMVPTKVLALSAS